MLTLVLLAFECFAIVDAAMRPTVAYAAAGKLTKPAWLAILIGAAVVTYFGGAIGVFGIAAVVATIVYFVDVRPALRRLTSR